MLKPRQGEGSVYGLFVRWKKDMIFEEEDEWEEGEDEEWEEEEW